MATTLTHMERAVPCAMQRSTAASSRQMHMVAPRMAFVKATTFSAAAKSVESRSAITKAAFSVNAQVVASDVIYETMIVLRPDMSDEQRDQELAKFEAFLKKESASDVKVTVRGRQRLAYPIKRFTEGIYVLYTYAAHPDVSQAVQKNLSTPEAGSELNILRHMTFRV